MHSCFSTSSDGRQDPARSLRQAQRALLQHSRRPSEVRHSTNYPKYRPTPTSLISVYRTARNSKPIEVLGHYPTLPTSIQLSADCMSGTYDPIPKPAPLGQGKRYKDIKLDTARAKYWLGVGAQPSDPAWRLLSMVREARWEKCLDCWAFG